MQRSLRAIRRFCTVAPSPPATFLAEAPEHNSRLDRFIKRRAPGLPPGLIQRLIRQRRILVNNQPANRNAYPIRSGDEVKLPGHIKLGLSRRKKKPAENDVSLAESEMVRKWVLYRDARAIVLNKPAGLATQGGTGIGERHLERLLPGIGSGKYWLVHRLDKEVGGAILVARDVGAAGLLAEQFRNRMVKKVYWGLTKGVPAEKEGIIRMDIEGKKAETAYKVVQSLEKAYAWLLLQPRTGRKHQLRIHCAQGLGAPLVGDDKYGEEGKVEVGGLEALLGGGLHLFAREIEFDRLTGGGPVTVSAPLPEYMKDCWKRFGFDERRVSV